MNRALIEKIIKIIMENNKGDEVNQTIGEGVTKGVSDVVSDVLGRTKEVSVYEFTAKFETDSEKIKNLAEAKKNDALTKKTELESEVLRQQLNKEVNINKIYFN
jgi:hypothetical protein